MFLLCEWGWVVKVTFFSDEFSTTEKLLCSILFDHYTNLTLIKHAIKPFTRL